MLACNHNLPRADLGFLPPSLPLFLFLFCFSFLLIATRSLPPSCCVQFPNRSRSRER